jgi:glycerol kinase
MQADAGIRLKELRVDGGASENNLLLQIQADLLGIPVVRSKVSETTALGAAYLAGRAVGYWKNVAEIAAKWNEGCRISSKMKPAERRSRTQGWNRALERARNWELP